MASRTGLVHLVRVRGQTWKRHLDQLRRRHTEVKSKESTNIDDFTGFPSNSSQNYSSPHDITGPPVRHYPLQSNRQPPNRLTLNKLEKGGTVMY